MYLFEKKTPWKTPRRPVRSGRLITVLGLAYLSALALLLRDLDSVSAQITAPPNSTISTTSGPVSWDFGPVVAGTVTNVGLRHRCPPGVCDYHSMTLVLPAPAATFSQTNTRQLTIKYSWTSTGPTGLDIFAISPNGADHGPGSPEDTSTGLGEEDLTVAGPVD